MDALLCDPGTGEVIASRVGSPGKPVIVHGGDVVRDDLVTGGAITQAAQIAIVGRDRDRAVRALHQAPADRDRLRLGHRSRQLPGPNPNITGALADDSPGMTLAQPLAAALVIEHSEVGLKVRLGRRGCRLTGPTPATRLGARLGDAPDSLD